MGYCKLKCPDGETQCCICCERHGGCDNRCDMMDSYEYAEDCENYVKEDETMKLSELTNNQKRREFLEDYPSWNLWLDVPEVSEKYYSYPLPDNTMIIVKETEHVKGDDWWKKEERGGYYVTTEYFLLEGDWERFADCQKSMTQIIDHLRGLKS